MSPRTYLLTRFQADADALRQRAAALRGGPAMPGPDAATSSQMADACEKVVAMVSAVSAHDDAAREITSLLALVPLLDQHASVSSAPTVRAVFVGAATRIREVRDAEARTAHAPIDDEDIEEDS